MAGTDINFDQGPMVTILIWVWVKLPGVVGILVLISEMAGQTHISGHHLDRQDQR